MTILAKVITIIVALLVACIIGSAMGFNIAMDFIERDEKNKK